MNAISLLREKFVIHEVGVDSAPLVAMGNRLHITLPGETGNLVIRGHSMHITLRYGAEILRQSSYVNHIENIKEFFKWNDLWSKLIKPFESENTPETWIVVYFCGEVIFHDNFHHQFFDVIEQCEHKNQKISEKYEQSIIMAQNAFKKMGRNVLIEQESHIGFILDDTSKELRFAVILRLPWQRATFVCRMAENKKIKKHPYHFVAMNLAADYIEGINMAVRSGFLEKSGKNIQIYKLIQKRLNSLSVAINQAETQYVVKYRPEKPDFKNIQKRVQEDN